jgi:glycosyltransferase involved in cell wall biosynthesis
VVTFSSISRAIKCPNAGGISIVFPVFNESFIIEQVVRNYFAEFQGRVADFELIVAEDESTDDTKGVLERLSQELPIRAYMGEQRKGYQQAVIDAIALATKPWVFVVDSDYQFAVIDFWRLERYRDEYDLILGQKSPRRDPLYRVVLSKGYNFLLRRFFNVPYRDMDTGFRLIRKSVADELAPQVKFMSFFTAEFVVRAHYGGHRIVEVPVPHYARKIGSTSIFYVSKLLVICFRQLIGIFRMKAEFERLRKIAPTENGAAGPASGEAPALRPGGPQ